MESNCSELRGEAWEKSRCRRLSLRPPVREHPGPHSKYQLSLTLCVPANWGPGHPDSAKFLRTH